MSHHTITERELAARLEDLAGSIAVPSPERLADMAREATGSTQLRRPILARRRSRRLPVMLAAAAMVVAALLAANVLRQPTAAAAGVRFSHTRGFIVARITDPSTSAAALTAAFAEEGLDIHLSLAPVSPSLVGTVLYIGEDGGSDAGGIRAIEGGPCITGGGGCPVGLRIPRDYSGTAYITLGRAAREDESYASTTSVFAPGEPLHCSGLIGRPVEQLDTVLAQRGFTVEWAPSDGSNGGRISEAAAAGQYVVNAEHMAADRVLVSVSPIPLAEMHDSELDGYIARLNAGC